MERNIEETNQTPEEQIFQHVMIIDLSDAIDEGCEYFQNHTNANHQIQRNYRISFQMNYKLMTKMNLKA